LSYNLARKSGGFSPGLAIGLAGFLVIFVSLLGRFGQLAKEASSASLPAWRAIMGTADNLPGSAPISRAGKIADMI
jgi:hypothetical protein